MKEISEKKLHELIYNIKNSEQIEEIGMSLWFYDNLKGDIQLPVEDFLEVKKLFTERYCSIENRDFSEWCLLVSKYLTRYKKQDDVMHLLGTALADVKLRYYMTPQSVAVLEMYIRVLFHIAENYFNERHDYIYAAIYYAKAYELLVCQRKEIRDKITNYEQWVDEIFDKIDILMNMAEDNKFIDMRMLISMLKPIEDSRENE